MLHREVRLWMLHHRLPHRLLRLNHPPRTRRRGSLAGVKFKNCEFIDSGRMKCFADFNERHVVIVTSFNPIVHRHYSTRIRHLLCLVVFTPRVPKRACLRRLSSQALMPCFNGFMDENHTLMLISRSYSASEFKVSVGLLLSFKGNKMF